MKNCYTIKFRRLILGAITDVSDQFVMLNLKGERIFDLLSTGCPFNFNNFKTKKGAVDTNVATSDRCHNSPQRNQFC